MDLIQLIVTGLIPLWLGSIEFRIRRMFDILQQKPERKEVHREVENKLKPLEVLDTELKEDIRRVEAKLDLLISKALEK